MGRSSTHRMIWLPSCLTGAHLLTWLFYLLGLVSVWRDEPLAAVAFPAIGTTVLRRTLALGAPARQTAPFLEEVQNVRSRERCRP